MRDTIRPPPIEVSINPAWMFENSPSTELSPPLSSFVAVNSLSLNSPFTPGPLTAIPDKRSHVPTAFQPPFKFLDDFPFEIREKVYEFLVGDVTVIVNAYQNSPIQILKHRSFWHGNVIFRRTWSPRSSPRSIGSLHCNFLCISKRFFTEVRSVFHRCMEVKFERRWDFNAAYIDGSLHPDSSAATATQLEHVSLFPPSSNVFRQIQTLHISLCRNSDFDGRVHTAEARRVTSQMFQILQERNMPRLRHLFFQVDERSRICSYVMTFLPEAWFLEGLLSLQQLRATTFTPGPRFNGFSQNKRNIRACIQAMNAVLRAHFAAPTAQFKLDFGDFRGSQLQARLGRMMLHYFATRTHYQAASNALAMHVVMLEAAV